MTPDELALSLDLPKRTVALVLAGGRGSRLKNLTDSRAKPAVYFGGKFRIVDFALSNCLNSGIRRRNTPRAWRGCRSDSSGGCRARRPAPAPRCVWAGQG